MPVGVRFPRLRPWATRTQRRCDVIARGLRRLAALAAVVGAILLLTSSSTAAADGLYVGHGLRSKDLHPGWSSRIVVSGGLHAAPDPWEEFSDFEDFYDDWVYGGYGQAGLELAIADRSALEFFGIYQKVEDRENFFTFDFDAGRYRFENEAFGGGVTFRRYIGRRGSFSWWGFGTGLLHGQAEYVEMVNGVIRPRLDDESTSAEIHFVVGWEGDVAPNLAVGLELGYRETWLEGLADFDGFFVGLRLGLRLGRPDDGPPAR